MGGTVQKGAHLICNISADIERRHLCSHQHFHGQGRKLHGYPDSNPIPCDMKPHDAANLRRCQVRCPAQRPALQPECLDHSNLAVGLQRASQLSISCCAAGWGLHVLRPCALTADWLS